jgi:nucleotide-binding universal stress UspA family protein
MFRKVLLCTDFSEPSKKLMDCLPEMIPFGLQEVVLLHVVNIRSAGGNAAQFQKFNQDELKSWHDQIKEIGIEATVRVPIGFPPYGIVDTARDEDVTLILMGSIGKGLLRRFFMGSTAFDVLRLSRHPVLIEKFKQTGDENWETTCQIKMRKVLVPVDFSTHSLHAVAQMRTLLSGRGEIVLVSIIEKGTRGEEIRSQIETDLERLKAEAIEEGQSVSVYVRQGIPSVEILKLAEETDATLIALPKRGTGESEGQILGSTAEAVAVRSKIPVLLFPIEL